MARHHRRSHCGIKSGIDFDSLIVELDVGVKLSSLGLPSKHGHPGTTMRRSGGDDGTE